MPHISTYKELRVYQAAINAAVRIFELTKGFPAEERHSMTDQFGDLLDQCVRISAKPGDVAVIRDTLLARLMNVKVKPKKRESGWNCLAVAVTSPKSKL